MTINTAYQAPLPQRSAARPQGSPPPADRYEPTVGDRLMRAADFAMSCVPGAGMGALIGAGVGFNGTILLGVSAALKTAAVVGVIGGAIGGWVSHDLSGMD